MIKIIFYIAITFLLQTICYADLAKVQDKNIIFPDNSIRKIKGFGITNGVYTNIELNQVTVSNFWLKESDYKTLNKTGINSIRFYIQYHWLDSDQAEIFFEHFDNQIKMAKKYNIYLIPNLHYFGNYNNDRDDHFFKGSNKYNPTNFWSKFSNKYKKEEQLLAYDLINEPTCHGKWREFELYSEYDNIVESLRNKQDKHILIVSDPVNKFNNLNKDWFWGKEAFLKIDDANIIYAYHWYEPTLFTFQSLYQYQGMELGAQFPYTQTTYSKYINGIYNTKYISSTNNKWEKYSTTWIKPSRMAKKGSHFVISLSAADCNGKVWFDDIALEEKNIKTGKIQNLKINNADFSQVRQYREYENLPYPSNLPSGWYFQNDADSQEVFAIIDTKNNHSKNNSGSLLIDGETASWSNNSWARWSQAGGTLSQYYKINPDCEYKISAYIKTENNSNKAISIHFETYNIKQTLFSQKTIRQYINDYYTSWAKTNNVPLYCSEFGLTDPSNQNDHNSPTNSPTDQIKWVKTMNKIINETGQNWTYHSYKDFQSRGDMTFGIFDNAVNNNILKELKF